MCAEAVQTDIKSALSFASLSQVGIIVTGGRLGRGGGLVRGAFRAGGRHQTCAVAFALQYIALIHLLGHACLRTLAVPSPPTLLHDFHLLENAIGEHLPAVPGALGSALQRSHAERGFTDLRSSADILIRRSWSSSSCRSFTRSGGAMRSNGGGPTGFRAGFARVG